MTIDVLDTSDKYYAEVLTPEVADFFDKPSTFRSAFNVARTLFHFHEWLFEDRKADLEQHFGAQFGTPGEFWKTVEASHASFGFIRDFANASKHVRLTRRPSTSMTHVANTSFQVTKFSSQDAVWGASRWGASLQINDDGVNVSFDFCVSELDKYWKDLHAALPRQP